MLRVDRMGYYITEIARKPNEIISIDFHNGCECRDAKRIHFLGAWADHSCTWDDYQWKEWLQEQLEEQGHQKIDNMGLPYEETTYRHIVEDIIADYNAGRDKTKQGIICSQYEKENTGFDKLGKGYEKRCSREMMANYINAKSSNALLFNNTYNQYGENYN